MKQTRRWLAALLTAVLLLGALPGAALAEGTSRARAEEVTVTDSAGFRSALKNSDVKTIYFQGNIKVAYQPGGENDLKALDKNIFPLGKDYSGAHSLSFDPGVTLTQLSPHEGNVPQAVADQSISQIYGTAETPDGERMPDMEHLTALVPGTVGWYEFHDESDGEDDPYAGMRVCYTMYCGDKDDAARKAADLTAGHWIHNETGEGDDNRLVFLLFGENVTLTGSVETDMLYVLQGGSLTIPSGVSVTVHNYMEIAGSLSIAETGALTLDQEGYLNVTGDLSVAEGGLLTLGRNGGWVEGDVEFLGPEEPEQELLDRLEWGGESYYTHLAARWSNGYYDRSLRITPMDEYDVTFALQYYGEAPGGWQWQYKEVSPTIPQGLRYGEREGDRAKVLTADAGTWNQTYRITYEENGYSHSLPVTVGLPELGCYRAPAPTTGNYLGELSGSPLTSGKFYVCADPNAWFMDDENWTLPGTLETKAYREDESGSRTEVPGAIRSCSRIRDGVWEVTVTACHLSAEFKMRLVWAGDPGDAPGADGIPTCETGLWIDASEEQLVYSDALLTGSSPYPDDSENLDRVYQDGYRSLLHDTLSLNAGTSRDVVLYLLRYDYDSGRWMLEHTSSEWAEGRGGVTLAGAPGKESFVRVTAGSGAAAARIARLDGREISPDMYEPIPGSTRGTPLTVSVTGGAQQGGSSDSSDRDGTHTVSTPVRTVGGEVKVQTKNAKKGDQVTVTVTAREGYVLKSLTVTDAKGNAVAVTDRGNGTFTFTMPDSRVKVTPDFRRSSDVQTPAGSFTDVPSDAYYYDAVLWAVEQGITGGTTATTFSPNASCSRAQTVTFLWRAAGSPAPAGRNNPFRDVQPGTYYYDAVLWAVEQGITGGTTATTFSPADTVTRGQVATFLHRAAGSPAATGSGSFADVASGAYYAGPVQWAVEQGITAGTSASSFSPNANCTRGQIVTFLYRGQNT